MGGLASIIGGQGSGRISGQFQTLAEQVHDEGVSFFPPKQSVETSVKGHSSPVLVHESPRAIVFGQSGETPETVPPHAAQIAAHPTSQARFMALPYAQ
jgi:hypothetical protein